MALPWSLQSWEEVAPVAAPVLAGLIAFAKFLFAKRPRSRIRFHEVETRLIDNLQAAIPNFEASYNNAPINDLAVSQFFIWNSGTEAIHRTDIAPKEPLRIVLNEQARVLECAVLRVTNVANSFEARVASPRTVDLSFDFLNLKDGALVQILFTGASGAETQVEGQIIGHRPEVEYTGDEQYRVHGWVGEGGLLLLPSRLKMLGGGVNFVIGSILVAGHFFQWTLAGLLVGLALLVVSVWTWLPDQNRIPKALREKVAGPPKSSQADGLHPSPNP